VNETVKQYWSRLTGWWDTFTRKQQITILAVLIFSILLLTVLFIWLTRPEYEVAFYDLEPKDAQTVTQQLEEMGIPYRLSQDGTMVSVPKSQAAQVKVQLADKIKSGSIGYEVFMQNLGLGMTQEQFQVLEKGVIEGELERLIRQLDGVRDANVMITMPQRSVWLTDDQNPATASVVLQLEPGTELEPQQINSLYQLISKSVPNLPVENISIVDQNGMLLSTVQTGSSDAQLGTVYEQQEKIRVNFQQRLQQEIQRTLGAIFGPDRVMVQVFANLNFDQEKRQENLVEPVVDDQGLPISEETIQEQSTGSGLGAGGIVGTGTGDVPRYVSEGEQENGTYERLEERINYEVNRITREVIASPYRVEDLSIAVWFEPADPDDVAAAEQDRQRIINMLTGIVSASLSGSGQNWTMADIQNKIAVDYRTFDGYARDEGQPAIPWLIVGAIAAGLVLLNVLLFWLFRRRRQPEAEEAEMPLPEESLVVPPEELPALLEESDEAKIRKKIQEAMQKNPQEFIRIFRSWMVEE